MKINVTAALVLCMIVLSMIIWLKSSALMHIDQCWSFNTYIYSILSTIHDATVIIVVHCSFVSLHCSMLSVAHILAQSLEFFSLRCRWLFCVCSSLPGLTLHLSISSISCPSLFLSLSLTHSLWCLYLFRIPSASSSLSLSLSLSCSLPPVELLLCNSVLC